MWHNDPHTHKRPTYTHIHAHKQNSNPRTHLYMRMSDIVTPVYMRISDIATHVYIRIRDIVIHICISDWSQFAVMYLYVQITDFIQLNVQVTKNKPCWGSQVLKIRGPRYLWEFALCSWRNVSVKVHWHLVCAYCRGSHLCACMHVHVCVVDGVHVCVSLVCTCDMYIYIDFHGISTRNKLFSRMFTWAVWMYECQAHKK